MKLTLRSGQDSRTLRVLRRGDCLRVTFEDGHDVELRLLSSVDGGFELERGHARIHGAGASLNGRRQLWVNGHTVTYERVEPRSARHSASSETQLTTAIPAVVTQVLAAPGQRVRAGDKLVMLESMKMVIPVTADADGVVEAVLCSPGDAVEAGQELVEIEKLPPRPRRNGKQRSKKRSLTPQTAGVG